MTTGNIVLESGQKETVTFELREEQLGYFHSLNGGFYPEDGDFKVMVGASSVNVLSETVAVSF